MSWRNGSETIVGHTGCLGFVAAVMAIIPAYVHKSDSAVLTLTLFAVSLAVFLVAADQFSEALDFGDFKRYSRAIKLHNLGVVLMLWHGHADAPVRVLPTRIHSLPVLVLLDSRNPRDRETAFQGANHAHP